MMDRGRAQDVAEAARRFAESLADSYRVIYERAADSTERQQALAREFSELVAGNLREQSEANRSTARRLSEQADKQREAGQALARESVEAYVGFLDSAFAPYRMSAQGQARAGTDAAANVVDLAANTTRATADAMADTGQTEESAAGPPFEDYDDMNVDEITEQLDKLSDVGLVRVRDYERRNENRRTLLAEVERRMEASS